MDTSNLTLSSLEERAVNLLGQGIDPVTVASAIGVSESRISQIISDPHIAAKIAELRYGNLAKFAERDAGYDALEDELLEKLKNCLPYMIKPMEILASIRIINGAKRRGAGINPTETTRQTVVKLTLPLSVINQFRVDVNNQVIQAGEQELVTIQTGNLKGLLNHGHQSHPPQINGPNRETSAIGTTATSH